MNNLQRISELEEEIKQLRLQESNNVHGKLIKFLDDNGFMKNPDMASCWVFYNKTFNDLNYQISWITSDVGEYYDCVISNNETEVLNMVSDNMEEFMEFITKYLKPQSSSYNIELSFDSFYDMNDIKLTLDAIILANPTTFSNIQSQTITKL